MQEFGLLVMISWFLLVTLVITSWCLFVTYDAVYMLSHRS